MGDKRSAGGSYGWGMEIAMPSSMLLCLIALLGNVLETYVIIERPSSPSVIAMSITLERYISHGLMIGAVKG